MTVVLISTIFISAEDKYTDPNPTPMPPYLRLAISGGSGYSFISGDFSDYYSNNYSFQAGIKFSIPKDFLYFKTGIRYFKHNQTTSFTDEEPDNLNSLKTFSIFGGMIVNFQLSNIVVPFMYFEAGTIKISSENKENIENQWTSTFQIGGGTEIFPGTQKFSISISGGIHFLPLRIIFSEDNKSGLYYSYKLEGEFNYYLY